MAAIADSKTNLHLAGPEVAPGNGAAPATLARIVVPVDGSPFAERALPVAAWLAQATGAPMHLVEVVARPTDTERTIHYLDGLTRRYAVAGWDATPGGDPAAAIVATTAAGRPSLACLRCTGATAAPRSSAR